jgi:IS605 OrfB family transposase
MEMLKQCKYRTLPIKNLCSGIRFNARTITVNLERGLLSISTIDGRKKYHFRIPSYFKSYVDWLVDAATLRYSNGNLILSLNCFKEDVIKRDPKRVIGIDRGLRNIAVLSNNVFINSNHLTAVKRRYEHLRSILQQKGTRSTKRKLKEISGSEKRFVKDANHCLSKRIASMPASVFALEDLNISRGKRNGRLFNKSLNRWSFFQLEQMIAYKAEALGKHVVFVDPRNTSITCSKCGHADKESRKLSRFRCIECGFDIDADLNAARNIAFRGKSLVSRLQRRSTGKSCGDRS